MAIIGVTTLLTFSCKKPPGEVQTIFPIGELGPAEHFTGKAWHYAMVANDTNYNTLVGNVYFEPGPEATGTGTQPVKS